MDNYRLAQRAISDLKAAILAELRSAGDEGRTNAEVGRALGIYQGYGGSGQQEGHISRTLLARLQEEGLVTQSDGHRWKSMS